MSGGAAPRRLLVAEASLGGVIGGSLTGALAVIERLDPARFTVVLGTAEQKPAGLPASCVPLRVPRRRSPAASGSRAIRFAGRALEFPALAADVGRALALLRREAPALVYLANGVGPHLPTVVAAAALRVPVVCHLKGFRRVGVLDRLASRHVRTAVAMTDRIAAHYRLRGLRPRRIVTIPDGVDCERFAPGGGAAVRQALEIPASAPVVGIVGHLQAWKGQALLLEAVALVRRTLPDVRCLLVGGVHRAGEDCARALHGRAAAADLAGCVHFAGARSDVPACMDAMDVVVHASVRPEPFGRVLIEAMAVGRPVIAPREGGPLDVVLNGRTGVLVPPRDPRALAAALVALLRDPDAREAMGRAGRERARSVFGIDRHVAALVAVFEDAIAGGGAGDAPG